MTRIIAGALRGRRLAVPRGSDIRPTTDRMRERLFSMLQHDRYPPLAGAGVVDLFAGTGALGLEALSRGAAWVTFVDNAPGALSCLRENISALNAGDRCKILRTDARHIGATETAADIIFMDPPYRQGLIPPTLSRLGAGGWLHDGSLVVAELASDEDMTLPMGWTLLDDRSQGAQRIVFLKPDGDRGGG